MTPTMSLPKQQCAITVLGGPTTVIDLGGLRIVTDPTFDEPGPHGAAEHGTWIDLTR